MGYFSKIYSLFNKSAQGQTLDRPEHVQLNQVERRSSMRLDARKGTNALIVDDSPTIVFALKKMLESTGYNTFQALNAEQGIELARAEQPDIIFLDIVLPGMNGFTALRLLRRDPATQPIPIIMMSSNEQATEQFFGSRIGADDFMKKPFSRLEVFARIERLLGEDMLPHRSGSSAQTAAAGGAKM
ncbi:MAG TPA: response regulator [Burkholderiales bacterium]|nr:response regulator [Burkholderiales bacterium]